MLRLDSRNETERALQKFTKLLTYFLGSQKIVKHEMVDVLWVTLYGLHLTLTHHSGYYQLQDSKYSTLHC